VRADQHQQRRGAERGHGTRGAPTLAVSRVHAGIDDRRSALEVRPDEEPPPRWHLWGFWGLVALAYGLAFAGLWELWQLLGG
jgi:hypothetical protein